MQLQKYGSSIPTNRANGVAVFESSPVRYNNSCMFYHTMHVIAVHCQNLLPVLLCVYTCLEAILSYESLKPGRVAQSVGHLTRKSGVQGSIPGLATYFRFSFRFFKKGSCQLLAKVCARSTG